MPIKVMLVDDHRMLREGLRRALEDEGFVIVGEAADGREAVERVAALDPDIVLMDVSMPILGGLEAARRIVDGDPDRRVLMLTMHADQDLIDMAHRSGAVGYLTKDCSIDELSATITRACGGRPTLAAPSGSPEVDGSGPDGAVDDGRVISRREAEVLQLIADGCSTSEVAVRLFISQKTVKNHLGSIYDKLDARDRTQAVVAAVRLGIIKLE